MAYRRNPDVFFSIVDDELIILDEGGEKFLTSNMVASFIWEKLENPISKDDLVDAIVNHFEGASPDAARADLEELLEELCSRDLVLQS